MINTTKIFNNIEEIEKYYKIQNNTYIFVEDDVYIDLVIFNFDLKVDACIDAIDIRAENIRAMDILACDIIADSIDANIIKCDKIRANKVIANEVHASINIGR